MAKRHVQQDLVFSRRGGKRPGAGRKRKSARPSTPHRKRAAFRSWTPLSITLRVVHEVARLRTATAYQACWQAMKRVYGREDFRIVDITLQHGHIHLTVEAENRRALSRGMQAFKISAARRLNRAAKRKGIVFPERYHENRITCPTQARNARAYVMLNWRRHGEDRGVSWRLDPFSSAISFPGWVGGAFRIPAGYDALPVRPPRTWLLSQCWKKQPLDYREVPGKA
jgi:REP element-mobilizing transposase RayT